MSTRGTKRMKCESGIHFRRPCNIIAVDKRPAELLDLISEGIGKRFTTFEPFDQWHVEAVKQERECQCLCTQPIKWCIVVRHIASQFKFAIGKQCVERFLGETHSERANKMYSDRDKPDCKHSNCSEKVGDGRTSHGKKGYCSKSCMRIDQAPYRYRTGLAGRTCLAGNTNDNRSTGRMCEVDGCSTRLDPSIYESYQKKCRSCYFKSKSNKACITCGCVVMMEAWKKKCNSCWREQLK